MKLVFAFLVTGLFLASLHADPIKVACVGDSITFGVGVKDPAKDSYPAVLGRLLGKHYEVRNFGASGTTLLEKANNPYRKTEAFKDALNFSPKIVVIALGTNDSKTRNWDGRQAEFVPDYEDLMARFAKLPSRPQIFLCLPTPSFRDDADIREFIIQRQRGIIRQIAAAKHLPVIDLYTPLKGRRKLLPDGIHPNATGATIVAKAVAQAIQK